MNTLGLEMLGLVFFFLESLDSITSICSKWIAFSLVAILIMHEIGEGVGFLFSFPNKIIFP